MMDDLLDDMKDGQSYTTEDCHDYRRVECDPADDEKEARKKKE